MSSSPVLIFFPYILEEIYGYFSKDPLVYGRVGKVFLAGAPRIVMGVIS